MTSETASRRFSTSAVFSKAAALSLAVALASTTARADTKPEDKAAAEALFKHARELMKQNAFAEACPKLAESQRLDPGLGTMLYLADCHEQEGRLATAWGEFLQAQAAATTAGDLERANKAAARAAALQPKVSTITITLAPGADIPGLELRGNGRKADRQAIGTPFPVDPGDNTITATAPGKVAWSATVHVDAAAPRALTVLIPKLGDAAPDSAVPVAAPPPVIPSAMRPTGPGVAPVIIEHEATPGRKAGYALIGVGLGTVAIGGILGAVTLLKKTDAVAGCRADNVCTPSSASGLDSARSIALGSTVTLSLGGAIFAAGVVVTIATRPAEDDHLGFVKAPRVPALALRPIASPVALGLATEGSF